MKSDEIPMIVCIRPGEGGQQGMLSELGAREMKMLKEQIDDFIKVEYSKSPVSRLLVCFSFNTIAYRSIQRIRNSGDCCLVKDWAFSDRNEIVMYEDPEMMFEDVLTENSRHSNPVIIIVAHGDMPSVLAEIAYKKVTGKSIALDNNGSGTGFCIMSRAKKIYGLTVDGATNITPI